MVRALHDTKSHRLTRAPMAWNKKFKSQKKEHVIRIPNILWSIFSSSLLQCCCAFCREWPRELLRWHRSYKKRILSRHLALMMMPSLGRFFFFFFFSFLFFPIEIQPGYTALSNSHPPHVGSLIDLTCCFSAWLY